MKDLIVTTISKNYNWIDIKNWIISLKNTSYNGDVLVLAYNFPDEHEYIDKLNSTMSLFKTVPVSVAEVKILPEHATYLRMYGYPVGGIFDPELLNAIKLELLDNALVI